MLWQILAWRWLANAAVGGLLVLFAGGLAVRLSRQPAQRARLIVLTLISGLIVTAIVGIPNAPRWTARVIPAAARDDVAGGGIESSGLPAPIAPRTRSAAVDTIAIEARAANPTPDRGVARAAPPVRVASNAVSWPVLIPALYLAISAGLAAWWLLGQFVLWRLMRSSLPVPTAVRADFLRISGQAGEPVRLLASDRITMPFTFTWDRPVILLPADLCLPGDEAALRYALAHEWSHVERGDAWAWNLAALAGAVLFYQPLFWWLRRQLRLSQDYLADDRAAAAGSPDDYAAYLVRLARAGRPGWPLPALGVGDRRSNLYRRVVVLVEDREPWERRCRTAWSLAAAAGAAVVIAAASGFRLEAADPAPTPGRSEPAIQDNETGGVRPPAPKATEGKTYVGRVTDKDTRRPIASASVLVRISILGDPALGSEKILSETRQQTDAEGKYAFTLSPKQVATPWLFIYLDINHPGHVKHYGGYAYGMIARNEKVGSRPWFEDIRLQPGTSVSGRLVNPQGAPVAGVPINAFCRDVEARKKDVHEFGSFTWTSTDADGRFRLDLFRSGPAVVWICPRDYALSTHVLKHDKRGDLGTIALQTGQTIRGRVLDAQGKPAAGVYVQADHDRERELEAEKSLEGVGGYICRTVVTGSDGAFAIRAMPAGPYRLTVVEKGSDPATRRDVEDMPRRPLPGVFTARRLTVKDSEPPEPVAIRAVAEVVIEARIVDSHGKKSTGHPIDLVGSIDGAFWSAEVPPDADGVYTVHAPRGLKDAQLSMSTNEHTVLRFRRSKDVPLSNSDGIPLGTIEHDIKGIEIIRYAAPIVVVKVTTRDGSKPVNIEVWANYTAKDDQRGGGRVLKGGIRSDCGFEQARDGRFRSEGVYPDEGLTVTARAKGYASKTSAVFALPEGATREVELVLEKTP